MDSQRTESWHNDQWMVPINFSIAQLTTVGHLPLQFAIGAKLYADGPSGAPDWVTRFTNRRQTRVAAAAVRRLCQADQVDR